MTSYLRIFVNEIKGFAALIKNISIVKNERPHSIVRSDSGAPLLFHLCGVMWLAIIYHHITAYCNLRYLRSRDKYRNVFCFS